MADIAYVRGLARASDFLAVLAVARGDGTVHASLVKAGIIEDPEDGAPSIGIVVAGKARKLALLRKGRWATAVFHDAGRWVAVEGPARLEGPDDPGPPGSGRAVSTVLRDVYKAAGGSRNDWDEFDRVMAAERRCALFVKAARIVSNA